LIEPSQSNVISYEDSADEDNGSDRCLIVSGKKLNFTADVAFSISKEMADPTKYLKEDKNNEEDYSPKQHIRFTWPFFPEHDFISMPACHPLKCLYFSLMMTML
jgi:hypothetical protein